MKELFIGKKEKFLWDCIMISVIIPVYNGEKYIRSALENFRKQTSKNFELIFVDDGSTDKSGKILDEIKDEKFSVSVFHKENGGVSSARNLGIEKANGDYISFVDDDDIITEDFIETLEKYGEAEKSDLLLFMQKRVSNEKDCFTDEETVSKKEVSKTEILTEMVSDPKLFSVCTTLFRTEFIKKNSLAFPVGCKYYEDYDFLYRSLALSEKTVFLRKVMYFYIMRAGSAMNRFSAERIRCLYLMKRLEKQFYETVPEFAPTFEKWGAARLYWSVLWQACVSFDKKSVREFAKLTDASSYMNKLHDFPDKKVKLSSRLWNISPLLFISAANALGGKKTRVEKKSFDSIKDDVEKAMAVLSEN